MLVLVFPSSLCMHTTLLGVPHAVHDSYVLIIPFFRSQFCKSCSFHYCRLVFLTLLPVWGWYGAEIISKSRCSSDDCEAPHDFNLSPHSRTVDTRSFYLRLKCGSRQGGDATTTIANSARCSAITLIRCGTSCPVLDAFNPFWPTEMPFCLGIALCFVWLQISRFSTRPGNGICCTINAFIHNYMLAHK